MDSLDSKLRTVIGHLTHSARTSKIISINAALIAEQLLQGRTQETAALKTVAGEIQRLSDEAAGGIAALHAILAEVQLLTQTINLAGRQRMISQKVMKLFLLRRAGSPADIAPDPQPLIEEFEVGLSRLRACSLNTSAIDRQLEHTTEVWRAFVASLRSGVVATAATLNERVLTEMHATVVHYEELAGARSPEPAASVRPVEFAQPKSMASQPAISRHPPLGVSAAGQWIATG
jgi:hypothetical protein